MKEEDRLIKFLANMTIGLPLVILLISLRMAAPVPIRTQCFKHKIGL